MRKASVSSGMAAMVVAAGLLGAVPAARAQAPIDNSNDTVTCGTVIKGVIKPKPTLKNGGTSPTIIGISGKLGGCSSPSNPSLTFPEGKSSFKGVLNSATNDCAGLAGVSPSTGTITIKWKIAQAVTQTISTVTIPAGGSVGGLSLVAGDVHGTFGLGAPAGGSALTVTGAFTGGTGGAGATASVVTQESVSSIGVGCADPLKGLKVINLGVTGLTLQ